MDAEPASGAARRRTWPYLLALVAAAAALRLLMIDDRELWLDEAHTAHCANLGSWSELLDTLRRDVHAPLYLVAMRAWVMVVGDAEPALRAPSVIGGVLLVVVVWRLARRLGLGDGASLLAAALAALSPLLVHYGVEARAYSLLWLATAVAFLALRECVDGDSSAWAWVAGLASAVAVYLHLWALFLGPIWLLAWAASRRGRRLHLVLAGAAAALAFLPWALFAASVQVGGAAVGDVAESWIAATWRGPLAALADTWRAYALRPPFPTHLRGLGWFAVAPGFAAALLVWFGLPPLAALVRLVRQAAGSGQRGWARAAMLPAMALLPVVVPAALSTRWPVYVVGRYELLGYFAWVLLWAMGIEELATRAARTFPAAAPWLAVAVWTMTLGSLGSLAALHAAANGAPRVYEQTARCVVAAQRGRDDAVVVGLARPLFEYSLRRAGFRGQVASYPRSAGEHVGWFHAGADDDATLEREAKALAGADAAAARRFWLASEVRPDGTPVHDRHARALFVALSDAGWHRGADCGAGLVRAWELRRLAEP